MTPCPSETSKLKLFAQGHMGEGAVFTTVPDNAFQLIFVYSPDQKPTGFNHPKHTELTQTKVKKVK